MNMDLLRSPAARKDKALADAVLAVNGGLLRSDDICRKCGEVADDGYDGLCLDCYRGEHGPPDSYWEARDNSGPYEPLNYREDMRNAGRGHLL